MFSCRCVNASNNRTEWSLVFYLDLALAKHLVELHGGTLEAASECIGYGSTLRRAPRCAHM
jgi:hypothetical protein